MNDTNHERIRTAIRTAYAEVAGGADGSAVGCCGTSGGCGARLGYTEQQLAGVPEGADMGLGCGNPHAHALIRSGQTVLDLGSGGGIDCFIAADSVGAQGFVIGVDMTPEMVSKARDNARKAGVTNVDFRLGEIEALPVADSSVDVILSNCVVNLSPDKRRVFQEAFRVLRPGGVLAISDIVATAPIPETLADDIGALTGCISGAISVAELRELLGEAGFEHVRVEVKTESRDFIQDWLPGTGFEDLVASASIVARRPLARRACCGSDCCASEGSE